MKYICNTRVMDGQQRRGMKNAPTTKRKLWKHDSFPSGRSQASMWLPGVCSRARLALPPPARAKNGPQVAKRRKTCRALEKMSRLQGWESVFPFLKIEKFVAFTKFPFHVFDRCDMHLREFEVLFAGVFIIFVANFRHSNLPNFHFPKKKVSKFQNFKNQQTED